MKCFSFCRQAAEKRHRFKDVEIKDETGGIACFFYPSANTNVEFFSGLLQAECF